MTVETSVLLNTNINVANMVYEVDLHDKFYGEILSKAKDMISTAQ